MKLMRFALLLVICLQLILPARLHASNEESDGGETRFITLEPWMLPGLERKVEIIEDEFGIPHIFAKKIEDAVFMQGFLHARDRFFSMDVTRRTAEGTLAELLGPGDNNVNLNSDVQLRALGLARAAQATFPMFRAETRRILKSYARGVNSFLKDNPLPAEYQALRLTQKRMWAETDTILVGKALALSLSFDLNDLTATTALQSYEAAGRANGFDGTALFFEDMFRSAPFDPAFTIPDANGTPPGAMAAENEVDLQARLSLQRQWSDHIARTIKPETLEMAREYIERVRDIPILAKAVSDEGGFIGSNWFGIAGQNTVSGAPLINNDPHLSLGTPPIWYQIHLNVRNGRDLNVIGVSLPGAPGVILGHNDNIAWGATTTGFDVTDVYQEEIVAEFGSISIVYQGKREQVIFRDETFRVNQVMEGRTDNLVVVPPSASIPARFPSVPRRNNGPLISVNLAGRTALSVQYTGTGPTFEIETFLDFNRAKNINDFKKGLEFFDVGSQNFIVADTAGQLAYFTTGEIPLREDLEAGRIEGVPPFFIRDGRTGNEWLPVRNRKPNQTLNYEILPFDEMPQMVNPARGFIVSGNNDPIGITADNTPLDRKRATGGIYYLRTFYANGSRAARLTRDIEQALAGGKKIGIDDARRIQASVRMRDAEIFMPFILQAFDNARRADAPAMLAALAANTAISEAVTRFRSWDFSTPTGLRVGFDSFVPADSEPSETQIQASVATTIYSLWRSVFVRNTLDAALAPFNIQAVQNSQLTLGPVRNLLDRFPERKGRGASGINFFRVPALGDATPEAQRDFVILDSLRQALDALAGPDFQAAFNRSRNQRDYRWGFLHRLILPHATGRMSSFSIPSEMSRFKSPLPGLFGLPRDGGFEVPNASGHNVRARTFNEFTFSSGPSERFTAVVKPGAIEAVNAIPGGQSGLLTSPRRDDLLRFWLVGDVYPLVTDKNKLLMGR